MNAEVKAVSTPLLISRDTRIMLKQQKIGASLSAAAKALMSLLKDGKSPSDLPAIECLSDEVRLLADL